MRCNTNGWDRNIPVVTNYEATAKDICNTSVSEVRRLSLLSELLLIDMIRYH